MDPGLSTSPNQFPDLGLSITGKGFSVKLFIDFKRHPASSDILFMRHLYVVLFDHSIVNIAIFEFNIAVPAQNGQNEFMFALAAPIKIS